MNLHRQIECRLIAAAEMMGRWIGRIHSAMQGPRIRDRARALVADIQSFDKHLDAKIAEWERAEALLKDRRAQALTDELFGGRPAGEMLAELDRQLAVAVLALDQLRAGRELADQMLVASKQISAGHQVR